MDLLSLVLAKQPLQKLLLLPRLLRQKKFLFIRSSSVNREPFLSTDVNLYIKICTMEGELSTESIKLASAEQVCYRAVFLHNAAVYRLYYGSANIQDVWTGLATGVPEIQAISLTNFIMRARTFEREDFDFVFDIGADASERQLTRINWTPGLRRVIEKFVVPAAKTAKLTDNALFGYLNMGTLLPRIDTAHYKYFFGLCLFRLGGAEQVERDDFLEKEFQRIYGEDILPAVGHGGSGVSLMVMEILIRGGYTHVFASNVELFTDYANYIATEAVRSCRLGIVRLFLPLTLPMSRFPMAPDSLERVKATLEMRGLRLPPDVLTGYRISLGERVDIRGDLTEEFLNNLTFSMGMPTFSQPHEDYWNNIQLSNCVMYDSAAVLAQDWDEGEIHSSFSRTLEFDAFRLGRGTGRFIGSPPLGEMILSGSRSLRTAYSEREVNEIVDAMRTSGLHADAASQIQLIRELEKEILAMLLSR